MLLSVGKGMRLYLYIAQVHLEGNSMVSLCMMLAILVMIIYIANGNTCDLLVNLLGISGVMGLHIYIALVGLDWGYE